MLSILWVVGAAIAIGFTLHLSWRLEGGAAAINDAGSLRMRTYRISTLLSQQMPRAVVQGQQEKFESTLNGLIAGDPARPLFLPNTAEVHRQVTLIQQQWQQQIVPLLQQPYPLDTTNMLELNQQADSFVQNINVLVQLIEQDNAHNTTMLRWFQLSLIGMAIIGSATMVYLLYVMVTQPVNHLHQGMLRLRQGYLDSRVRLTSKDELGALSLGFNQMAERLQDLLQTMEEKVDEKTQALEYKNNHLSALYQVSSFLHQSNDLESVGQGFLQRVMALTKAQAGVVRLLDPERGKLDAIAYSGMSPDLLTRKECNMVDMCWCGKPALTQGASHEVPLLPASALKVLPCQASGFTDVKVFTIGSGQHPLGIYTLLFAKNQKIDSDTNQLLETLGSHLGVAVTNARLAARDRQIAVMEERNLMAQGLHDSIAQSLSFLNLQVQMLESALQEHEYTQAQENLTFIKAGVSESYEDVRELLLNFRVRISKEDLPEAVNSVIARFEKQADVRAHLEMKGSGLPLNPQQQLQVIFILQEALSNVRKHAQATQVWIRLTNADDFVMSVQDNGRGVDLDEVHARSSQHVGMNIMQERAKRIQASISIQRMPHGGTEVLLRLPKEQRIAP